MKLFEDVQEEREELYQVDIESYAKFPTAGQDIYQFESIVQELEAQKSTIELKDILLENYSEREQAFTQQIHSLSHELALKSERLLELTAQTGQKSVDHDETLQFQAIKIRELSEENIALTKTAAAWERLLQQEQEKNMTYERKLEFLQSERVRLQGEVDESQRMISELDQDIDLLNDEIGRLTVL